MNLNKLQNLLNECIMLEQGNYIGGNFGIDLKEAQEELDQAKKLIGNHIEEPLRLTSCGDKRCKCLKREDCIYSEWKER